MRQCEFREHYDPNLGMYVKKHIYDEDMSDAYGKGLSDIFKSVGRKILGRTAKKAAKSAAKSAAKNAATATGEYAGKKAGDKIVELLIKNKTPSVLMEPNISPSEPKELTDYEINERVNQILSGGKLRRRKFI